MVNSEDFANRLERVFEYYDLTATTFSEKINVGKATISHILTGRNKPSLDFVLKTVKAFPEVELYWLLNGKGGFPASTPLSAESKNTKADEPSKNYKAVDLENNFQNQDNANLVNDHSSEKKLVKVILCYDDGSFENFTTN